MRLYENPVIPEVLEPMWDEHAQLAHERLAKMQLSTFLDEMPQTPHVDGSPSFTVFEPKSEFDESHGVIVPLVALNNMSPAQGLRMQLLADVVQKRIFAFGNNVFGNRSYSLSPAERNRVKVGDFGPIAEQQLRTVDSLGVETVSTFGYSQGAAVGAAILRVVSHAEVDRLRSSGLIEPVNVIKRTKAQVRNDFFGSGIGNLIDAANSSAIPALSEAQGSDSWAHVAREFVGVNAGLLLSSVFNAENRAIQEGFTTATFFRDITRFVDAGPEPNARLTVGWGQTSRIAPHDTMTHRIINDIYFNGQLDESKPKPVHTIVVPEMGHTMGDNIVVHALLGKLSLNR